MIIKSFKSTKCFISIATYRDSGRYGGGSPDFPTVLGVKDTADVCGLRTCTHTPLPWEARSYRCVLVHTGALGKQIHSEQAGHEGIRELWTWRPHGYSPRKERQRRFLAQQTHRSRKDGVCPGVGGRGENLKEHVPVGGGRKQTWPGRGCSGLHLRTRGQ